MKRHPINTIRQSLAALALFSLTCLSTQAASSLIDNSTIEQIQLDKSGKYLHGEKQTPIKVGTGRCATEVTFVLQTSKGLLLDVKPPEKCGFRQLDLLIAGDVLPLTALSNHFKQRTNGAYAWRDQEYAGGLFFASNKRYTAAQVQGLGFREPLCPKGDPDCLNSAESVAKTETQNTLSDGAKPAAGFTGMEPLAGAQAPKSAMPPSAKIAIANPVADALSLNDPVVTAYIHARQTAIAKGDTPAWPPKSFSKPSADHGDRYGFMAVDPVSGEVTNTVAIEARFSKVLSFDIDTGLAVACLERGDQCGLINTQGHFVVPPMALDLYANHHEVGLIEARQHISKDDFDANGFRCGYIGLDGKFKIRPVFLKCGYFYHENSSGPLGRRDYHEPAQVQMGDGRWGFILPSGDWAIDQWYEELDGGLGRPVAVKQNGLWGFVTSTPDGKMRGLIEPTYRVVGHWYGNEKDYFFWASKTRDKLNEDWTTDGCVSSASGYVQGVDRCKKDEWTFLHEAPVWLYWLHQWLPEDVIDFVAWVLAAVVLIGGLGWTMLRQQLMIFRWIPWHKTARLLQIVLGVVPLAAFFVAIGYFTADDPVWTRSANASGFDAGNWMIWMLLLAVAALPLSLVFAAVHWYRRRRHVSPQKGSLTNENAMH